MTSDFDPEFDKLPDQPVTIGGDKSAAAWHPNSAPEVPHADLDRSGIAAEMNDRRDAWAKKRMVPSRTPSHENYDDALTEALKRIDRADELWTALSKQVRRLENSLEAESDRADRAEARIANMNALRDEWKRNGEQPDLWIAVDKALSA